MCPSEYIRVTNTPSADKNCLSLDVGYWAEVLTMFDHTLQTGEHHFEAVHTRLRSGNLAPCTLNILKTGDSIVFS